MTLTRREDGYSTGFRLVPMDDDEAWLLIIDDDGHPVWSWMDTGAYNPAEAHMAPDGGSAWMLLVSEDVQDGTGGVAHVPFDGTAATFYPLPYVHHGFTFLPDGRMVWLRANMQVVDGEEIAGDDVVVSDPDGGNAEVLFSTWDHWTPALGESNPTDDHYYSTWRDWSHANSVSVRADGSLLVSFHKLSAVLNLELDGDVRWVLTGTNSTVAGDFAFEGDDSERFERQHNPVEVPGGLLMFDNGDGEEASEAVEFKLDEVAYHYSRVWQGDADMDVAVPRQGDVQRMANGNTLVNWGSEATITELSPDGETVWELDTQRRFLGFSEQLDAVGGRRSME